VNLARDWFIFLFIDYAFNKRIDLGGIDVGIE